jgi:hypothetical protein
VKVQVLSSAPDKAPNLRFPVSLSFLVFVIGSVTNPVRAPSREILRAAQYSSAIRPAAGFYCRTAQLLTQQTGDAGPRTGEQPAFAEILIGLIAARTEIRFRVASPGSSLLR